VLSSVRHRESRLNPHGAGATPRSDPLNIKKSTFSAFIQVTFPFVHILKHILCTYFRSVNGLKIKHLQGQNGTNFG